MQLVCRLKCFLEVFDTLMLADANMQKYMKYFIYISLYKPI